jgi:RNA polymerase sigma factor for flagellar operon FliA
MTEEERKEAILSLLPMARKMARAVARFARHAEFDDCFSDGCLGVMRAVDSFDPTRGVLLHRYARPIIAGAILNGLRDRDPVSEVVRRTMRRAQQLRYEMANERGELPSMEEMETIMPELTTARVKAHRGVEVSLDAPLPPGEHLSSDWAEDPSRVVERRDQAKLVKECVEQLPERMRKVINEHYFKSTKTQAISAELGVTPQRVSQLHHAALEQLRQKLREVV